MIQPKPEVQLQTHPIDIYLENRVRFPAEELGKHAGQWVAFSPDGSRILDGCASLADLRGRVVQIHHAAPEAVVFERVATAAMILSGSELC